VLEVAAGSAHSLAIGLQPVSAPGNDQPDSVRVFRVLEGWGDNASGQASLAWEFAGL